MRQMIGVLAQLDRGMIVAKLRRGRRTKGEKGEYAYGGPAVRLGRPQEGANPGRSGACRT